MARFVYVSNGTAPQIQHNVFKDIETIQLQPPSLRISVLGWAIGIASLEFAILLFLCSTFPDIF